MSFSAFSLSLSVFFLSLIFRPLSKKKTLLSPSPESETHDPPVSEVIHPLPLEDGRGLVVPVDQHGGRDADVKGQEVRGQRRDAQRGEVLVVDDVAGPVLLDEEVEVVGIGGAVDRRVGGGDLEGCCCARFCVCIEKGEKRRRVGEIFFLSLFFFLFSFSWA